MIKHRIPDRVMKRCRPLAAAVQGLMLGVAAFSALQAAAREASMPAA